MKNLLVAVAGLAVLAGCSSTPDAPAVQTVPAEVSLAPTPEPFPAPPGYVEAMQALGGRGSAYELVHDAEDTCMELLQGRSPGDVERSLAGRLQVERGVARKALPRIKEYFCS